MTKTRKDKIFTGVIFALLVLGGLQFAAWIGEMAFENTCIELQEQYIGTEAREIIRTVQNSVNFGKELENYYGMDEVLRQIGEISVGNLKSVVLDEKGEVLYLSFDQTEENLRLLSQIYNDEVQQEIKGLADSGGEGEKLSLGGWESLVFSIRREQGETAGHFLVLYRQEDLIDKTDMASPLMFSSYQEKYSAMVQRNAESAAVYIQRSVEEMLDKGLPAERIGEITDYLNHKAESNDAIGSIALVKSYYNSKKEVESQDTTVLNIQVADGAMQLDIEVSQSYIRGKVILMVFTFIAVFVICLMLTYELTRLARIVAVRVSRDFNRETEGQMKTVGMQIRLLTFLTYTAIYISMSYTAVIMRNQGASLFGLPESISASLPLTVELFMILFSSMAVQKVFTKMKLNHLLFLVFLFLILGNAACITAESPYVLLGLRAVCGIGFGLLKYWLNSIVAAGSVDAETVGKNYAQLNAGVLGGITVGASLGSILAQSLGYQFNYLFTGLLCLLILGLSLLVVPWKMLNGRRRRCVEEAGKQPVRIVEVFRSRSVLKTIFVCDIPLNIGLMYVVAFLPVYMDQMGQSRVAVSYAYLINGLAGVYLGAVVFRMLGRFSRKSACVVTLLTGAAGILLLASGSGTGVTLLSAGIMGLFDGYGTPSITSYFTYLPHVQRADTAGMLTVFHGVGSAVQILCPMLYGMLIQPDGGTGRLMVFGLCFLAAAALFILIPSCAEQESR